MKALAPLFLASTAFLASAAPAPQGSTTTTTTSRVPDHSATPGSALTNAYWLIYLNQLRSSLKLTSKISKFDTALAAEARAFSERCLYSYREPDKTGRYRQAVTYVDLAKGATGKDVVVAAVDNWKLQGLYSLAAPPSASAVGCSATYCPSISYDDKLILPQINATSGWIADCIFDLD
ncbi:hypothetical protein JCM6882_006769 [Rhodosporidiobolus microsporus]